MATTQAVFTFSPRILDHLGITAYNSVRKCLGELVANAYDADASCVEIKLPDVLDENATIVISDDGVGMSSAELKEKFLYIGRDRRSVGDRSSKNRLVIGSKGIGKLAGFGIAERIRVTTRQGGEQSSITIDRASLDEVGQLNSHNFDIYVSETEADNGTTIELCKLRDGLHLPPADVVRRHLHKTMPVSTQFTIKVDDVECSSEDIHGEKADFAEDIAGIGRVAGFYIIANARQSLPGLAVRVRGRLVQDPSLFGLDTKSHGFFTAEKIAGEINAEFLDPENPEGQRHDLIKTSRDGFLEDSEVVQKFNEWAAAFVKKIVQGVDAKEIVKRTTTLLESPEVKKRLEALPPHIRGTATKVVQGIVAKLNTASDDDAIRLIEWILRYYESNVLKELMNAIIAVDIKEAEKLASLVNEWGISQLNSVAGIIETQINIISRLEELVASDTALEVDLHKLIESNLWLVKEGLEIWSSDKPLKKLLEGHFDQIYKDREDIRPDLVCRSQDENRAVILEFKRPKEVIKMEHVTQALEYEGIVKANRPNIEIVTYVVGRKYHPSVLAVREKQAQAGLHLWSFEEILQKSRRRFEKVLEILGR